MGLRSRDKHGAVQLTNAITREDVRALLWLT